ncbi:MAG: response regulator transcription factor [Chloroflexota bacterium]
MPNLQNILIVDIDDMFVTNTKTYLEGYGFTVQTAYDAYTAQALVKQMRIHIAIVSTNLCNAHDYSDTSGIDLAVILSSHTRVIMVSKTPSFDMVRQALAPRINGAAPAYEFIRKDDGYTAVLTAIRKVLKISPEATLMQMQRTATPEIRTNAMTHHPRSSEAFTLDMDTRIAIVDDEDVALNDREYRILNYFMDHAETVITREDIVDKILNEVYDSIADSNRVNNIISRLRSKIEPDSNHPRFIITRWGSGWMFYPDGDAPSIF